MHVYIPYVEIVKSICTLGIFLKNIENPSFSLGKFNKKDKEWHICRYVSYTYRIETHGTIEHNVLISIPVIYII